MFMGYKHFILKKLYNTQNNCLQQTLLQVSTSIFCTYKNLRAPKLQFTIWRLEEIAVDNLNIEAKSAKYLANLE